MPIFSFFLVVGSILAGLLFYADTVMPPSPLPFSVSQRIGIPDSYKVRSDPIQILTSAPAPAPDMMSPLVLAAAPKAQPTPEILAVEPAARAARAEAPSLTKRVSDRQPPVDPRQNQTVSRGREFGLAGW